MHVGELNRMGAQISISGNKAEVEGNTNFEAAELMATDLKGISFFNSCGINCKRKISNQQNLSS